MKKSSSRTGRSARKNVIIYTSRCNKSSSCCAKNITPSAKSFMDAKVGRKTCKKARLQKQLDENTEKMNVIKTLKFK